MVPFAAHTGDFNARLHLLSFDIVRFQALARTNGNLLSLGVADLNLAYVECKIANLFSVGGAVVFLLGPLGVRLASRSAGWTRAPRLALAVSLANV